VNDLTRETGERPSAPPERDPPSGPGLAPRSRRADPDGGRATDPDPRIGAALGKALQAHFDDLLQAPIPDRFLMLLAELEARERSNGD
jgi:hypothetical protein